MGAGWVMKAEEQQGELSELVAAGLELERRVFARRLQVKVVAVSLGWLHEDLGTPLRAGSWGRRISPELDKEGIGGSMRITKSPKQSGGSRPRELAMSRNQNGNEINNSRFACTGHVGVRLLLLSIRDCDSLSSHYVFSKNPFAVHTVHTRCSAHPSAMEL